MLYGEELRQSILATRKTLQEAIKRRAERISRWETDEDDCFISQRIEEAGINECNLQLAILEGDGCMDYEAIFDQDGNEVYCKWVNTRYGYKIVGNGVFANSEKALLKKTGWSKKMIKVPVWTKYRAGGSGLLGAYTGSCELVRWHTNMKTGEYIGFPN